MSTKYKIKGKAFTWDGGDGGGGTKIYPDLEALKLAHFTHINSWDDSQERLDEQFESALNGDDPYEDGEISDTEFEIEITDSGEAKLIGVIRTSWGQ
jgi:hypothetical protein